MTPSKLKKGHIGLIVFIIALFTALHLHREWNVAGAFGFPFDDAWIHCQFARNLASGNGMSYNPGVPMSGSTAPLWTLILAASYLVVPNFIVSAKVISLVLYLLSCILVYKMLIFILDDVRYALLGAVMTAMISRLMFCALSGMEVMLSVFLTLAGIYLHLLYRREGGLKHYASTAVFALASLARPESMVLPFFALLDSFVLGRIEKTESLRRFGARAAAHLLLFLALMTPYFLFNYSVTGKPFPSTFAAKCSGGLIVWLQDGGIDELWRTLSLYPQVYLSGALDVAFKHNIPLYWLMFPGALRIVLESLKARTERKALIIPLTFLLYPIFMGIFSPSKVVLVWLPRYLGNMAPLFVVMGIVGLDWCMLFFRSVLEEFWVRPETARRTSKAVIAAIVVTLLVGLSSEEYDNSCFYARAVQNINDMQVRIGRWMKDNTPPDAVLATQDIGAIAFFSERKIIDLAGLVTPEALSYYGRKSQYVSLKKPDYVIFYPAWHPDLPLHHELIHLFDVTLEINAICGEPLMTVYKTVWAEEREQERRAAGRTPRN
jgi:hypothetical protein